MISTVKLSLSTAKADERVFTHRKLGPAVRDPDSPWHYHYCGACSVADDGGVTYEPWPCSTASLLGLGPWTPPEVET